MNLAVLFFGQTRTVKSVAPHVRLMFKDVPVKYYANVWRDSNGRVETVLEVQQKFLEAYPETVRVRVPDKVSCDYVNSTYRKVFPEASEQVVSFIEGLTMMLEYPDWDTVMCLRPDIVPLIGAVEDCRVVSWREIIQNYSKMSPELQRRTALLQQSVGFQQWNHNNLCAPDLMYVFPREVVECLVRFFYSRYRGDMLEVTLPKILLELGIGISEIPGEIYTLVYRQHVLSAGFDLEDLRNVPFILEIEPLRCISSTEELICKMYREFQAYREIKVFKDFDWYNLEKYTLDYLLSNIREDLCDEDMGTDKKISRLV